MNRPEGEKWSAPDADGIITCSLDVGAASTLRGRRKRKGTVRRIADVPLWPPSWRELLRDWLAQGGVRRKWTGLLKTAGSQRVHDACQLLDALLEAGLVEVEERREAGLWQPLWIEFPDLELARELVGLTNRDKLQRLREERNTSVLENPILEALKKSLEEMPAERAIRRHDILAALDLWISGECNGTLRDFALFATGDTKGVSSAEWAWVESALSLEDIGISRHTPAIWLRAPLSFITGNGPLDLRGVPDCIGLTPETIDRVSNIVGQVERWRVLENRTVFEKVARHRGEIDGVIWVAGYAPSWWKKGMSEILELCPAPALVACDPDPAGIEIALDVGQIWTGKNLPWEPWGMDTGTLSTLGRRKSLTDDDNNRLNRLLSRPLPQVLRELSLWMLENGEKGEQEGILF